MFLRNDREDKFRRKAAIVIQCAYRCHLARLATKDRYRSQFRKVYDADAEKYIYQNKKSLEIDIKLPKYFKRDTLPSPRELEAPLEYNPGNEINSDGCALIITNTIFPLGKWLAQAPPELENDHDDLVDLLTHEYVGRMRPEHVLSLKNPSTDEVQTAFKNLRSVSRSYGFVFIYIATHIITITKSEKENKKENAYFAFKNSIWSQNTELVETTLSLTTISQLINKIPCKEKNIFLHYAHHTPPRKVLFPSSKLLYPPPTCLQRLADLCNSPVIGSCAIGSNLREYLKYHPGIQFRKKKPKSVFTQGDEAPLYNPQTDNGSLVSVGSLGSLTEIKQEDHSIDKEEDEEEERAKRMKQKKSIYQSPVWRHLLKDFEIPAIPEITKTPKPPKPSPTWKKDSSTDNKIAVQMPSEDDRRLYQRRVLYWQLRRGLAKPVNIFKQINIAYKKHSLTTPQQMSLIYKENSIFGRALIKALNGGASRAGSDYINLATVFLYIYDTMKKSVKKLNEKMKPKKSEEENMEDIESIGSGSVTSPPPVTVHYCQVPVLYIPKNTQKSGFSLFTSTANTAVINPEHHYDQYLLNRVFYRCAPPPAPERPYINAVKDDSVTLEWFNPPFQGIEATKYKIFVRNNTRNYRKWTPINYAGDIYKTVFTVRNLPIGVSCEFRVAAGNAGGWGEMSEETDGVIPGEDKITVVPARIKWRRLQQSGIIGILDYLDLNNHSYEDQEQGLKMILGVIQTSEHQQKGLKSYPLILKLIERIFENLKNYENNPIIISYCFHILGWCLLLPKYERKIRLYCMNGDKNLIQFIIKFNDLYYYHHQVQNAIQFLKQGDVLKYFKLQERKDILQEEVNASPVPKVMLTAKQILNQKQNQEDQPKERKYVLNFSIPGRHKVMFPADDSDDDDEDDSGDDAGDDMVDDAEIDEEIRKIEAKKVEEKKPFKAIFADAKKKKKGEEEPPPPPPAAAGKGAKNAKAPSSGKKAQVKKIIKVEDDEEEKEALDNRPVTKGASRKVSFAPESKKDPRPIK